MIGLDTNVLVRYITQDEPEQAMRAGHLIERRCNRRSRGRVTLIVLCEMVWVLRGAYRYEKRLVVGVLEQLLATAELQVENESVAIRALSAYKSGNADFADYVIVCSNDAAGCEATYSFDTKLANNANVRKA